MIRSRDHLAMALSLRFRDDRFETCHDFRMTLVQAFADLPVGQQGAGVDGQTEQVNRVLFVQSGIEIVLLLKPRPTS